MWAQIKLCFKQGVISTLSGRPIKLVDKFTYLDSNISSTESDVNIRIAGGLLLTGYWSYGNFISTTK